MILRASSLAACIGGLFSCCGAAAGEPCAPQPSPALALPPLSARAAATRVATDSASTAAGYVEAGLTGLRARGDGQAGPAPWAGRGEDDGSYGFRGDPCDDAFENTGFYNGVNGYSSEHGPIGWVQSFSVDDVSLADGQVTDVYWYSLDSYSNDTETAELMVSANVGGAPDDSSDVVFRGSATRDETGDFMLGYEVYLHQLTLSATVTDGEYFVGVRPVFDDPLGRSFIATADLSGADSYFKCAFFGFASWFPWGRIVGEESNLSMCIFLDESGDPTGACCTGGDCRRITRADCDSSGGSYRGDGTSCHPNQCPGAPGACCFEDGRCDALKPGPCDQAGGDFQGEGTSCRPLLCPIVDPCTEALATQGYFNGSNGLFNSRSLDGSGVIDTEIVVDVFFSNSDNQIESLHYYHLDAPSYGYAESGDYYLLHADGPGYRPGSEYLNRQGVSEFRLNTGERWFDYYLYLHSITGLTESVPAGTYWLGMRPNQDRFRGAAYWATTDPIGLYSYFRSSYYNVRDWIPVQRYFDEPQDFAFCAVGERLGQESGACCILDECRQLTEADCAARGGGYGGEGSACVPNRCPGAAGACCFESGGCEDLRPEECDAVGGDFLGEGEICTPGICPLPDACGDAVYTQIDYDGFNGLSSEDAGAAEWVVSITADDVTLAERAALTGFSWYSLDTDLIEPSGADYFVYYARPGCGGPAREIAAADNFPLVVRASDGTRFFGLLLWLNGVECDPIRVPPGPYFVGLRLQFDTTDRSFWATAPQVDCGAFLKSEFFGHSDFTPWGAVLGIETDVAFCAIGEFGGQAVGACCLDGGCDLTGAGDCSVSGGAYQGDDTTCYPNPCPGAAGACCLGGGLCEFRSPDDCSAAGGQFQGGDVECAAGLCPIGDPCDGSRGEVLFSNSAFDGLDGLSSENGGEIGWIVSYTVDDFLVDRPFIVRGWHWYSLDESDFATDGTADYIVLTEDDCAPAVQIAEDNVAYGRLVTGDMLFGLDVVQNNIDADAGVRIPLSPGRYWTGLRPVLTDEVRSFWATAGLTDCGAHFRSEFFGFPDWTNWSQLLRGLETDVAFCITGTTSDAPFGACCVDGGLCRQLTESECGDAGGGYGGDDSSCYPSPCPDAPGACCFDDGSCDFVQPFVCGERGGIFQGADVACEPGVCPPGDPCDAPDSVYNNAAYDGDDGLNSQRSDDIGLDAYVVDDLMPADDIIVSDWHWYTMANSFDLEAVDVIVLLRSETGAPGLVVLEELDIPDFSRIDTGQRLFGKTVWQNNLQFAVPLTGGQTYFVGFRSVDNKFNDQDFWLTAPVRGSQGYFRSQFFHYPKWTPVGQVLGVKHDFAFCANIGDPCAGVVCGDSNGDGLVDFTDIDCFTAALIGRESWEACGTAHGAGAYMCANDANGDGSVDFNDIDLFVLALVEGACP